MAFNLREMDYRFIGILASIFVLGGAVRILLLPPLPISPGQLLLFAELLAAVALLYGIRKGRRKWRGELARLIDIISLAVVLILIMQALSAIIHFVDVTPIIGVESGEEIISAGNTLGMLIAAYGFYEFSKAPWFHER